MSSSLCFLLVCLSLAVARPTNEPRYQRTVSYKGEILIRCPIGIPAVKAFLDNDYIDIWRITPNGEAEIRLRETIFHSAPPEVVKECVKINDIETLVQQAENYTVSSNADWFEEYHRYDEIVQWYEDLARENPTLVKYVATIGSSYEGRRQPAVHIFGGEETNERNIIYFQCQIHAREWISGATCMYIANYLVENYDRSGEVRDILDEIEFVFVPLVNPDGYEYTWTNDRLWRKNRRPGSPCDGVDLNRNYNDHWNEGGSSGNPCSETYHGASAASEPETQNTEAYFRSLGNIVGAIDWHSFSQLILRPYGWTTADSPDEAQLKALGDKMAEEIHKVHGMTYTSQKSIGLYPTSGTASDWFYSDDANRNNRYRAGGFTIELRPSSGGGEGFILPPSQIIPQGEEMIPAVLYFAANLNSRPLQKS